MSIVQAGGTWMARALALKLGRGAIKKGGVFGIGAGVIIAFGYLAHNFIKNRNRRNLKRIGDIEGNNPGIEAKKRIVV